MNAHSTSHSTDLRRCKRRVLFMDDDPCWACECLDTCVDEPPLTHDEVLLAIYDHYLAPLFDPIISALCAVPPTTTEGGADA